MGVVALTGAGAGFALTSTFSIGFSAMGAGGVLTEILDDVFTTGVSLLPIEAKTITRTMMQTNTATANLLNLLTFFPKDSFTLSIILFIKTAGNKPA